MSVALATYIINRPFVTTIRFSDGTITKVETMRYRLELLPLRLVSEPRKIENWYYNGQKCSEFDFVLNEEYWWSREGAPISKEAGSREMMEDIQGRGPFLKEREWHILHHFAQRR